MPSVQQQHQTLSEQEKGKVSFIYGNSCDVLAISVARLYQGNQGRWDYTGIEGAVSIVLNRVEKAHYIRIVDLNTTKTIFEQEIYENFEYSRQRDFFHTFEGDNAVFGLSFVNVDEAYEFQALIANIVPNIKKAEKENAKAGKRKGSFFSKVFHGSSSANEEKGMTISAPTGFKHDGHMGWGENGFEIRNIPPEWRELFHKAGVKKKDLQNPETAQFIYSVIGASLSNPEPVTPKYSDLPPPPPIQQKAPMKPGRSCQPPPPPPTQHKMDISKQTSPQRALEQPLTPIPSTYNYPTKPTPPVPTQQPPLRTSQSQQFQTFQSGQEAITYVYNGGGPINQNPQTISMQPVPQARPQQVAPQYHSPTQKIQQQKPNVPPQMQPTIVQQPQLQQAVEEDFTFEKHQVYQPPQQPAEYQDYAYEVDTNHMNHPPIPPNHPAIPRELKVAQMERTPPVASPSIPPNHPPVPRELQGAQKERTPPIISPRNTAATPAAIPPVPPANISAGTKGPTPPAISPRVAPIAAAPASVPPPPPPAPAPRAATTAAPPTTAVAHPPPSSGGRNALLESIRQGKELKPVDTSQPLPSLKELGEPANRSLVDTLSAAMAARRGHLGENEVVEDDDEDDDDWDL